MRNRTSKSSGLYKNWGVRMGNSSEMFGPARAFKEKYLKGMDYKRRSWQACSALCTICILVFVFSVSPKHLDIQMPQDEDLIETPMLRGQDAAFDFEEHRLLNQRIVEFMLESCDHLTTFDVLFCHNVLVDGQPFRENCFMLCKEKTFYANVKIAATDESKSIYCTETYASTKQRVKREQNIVITGDRFVKEGEEESTELTVETLASFTKVPTAGQDICTFQHAVDIIGGKWIQ